MINLMTVARSIDKKEHADKVVSNRCNFMLTISRIKKERTKYTIKFITITIKKIKNALNYRKGSIE